MTPAITRRMSWTMPRASACHRLPPFAGVHAGMDAADDLPVLRSAFSEDVPLGGQHKLRNDVVVTLLDHGSDSECVWSSHFQGHRRLIPGRWTLPIG